MSDSIHFCATGKTGLGHLRRLTNVAQACHRNGHAQALHLLCNAPAAGLTCTESSLYHSINVMPRPQMSKYLRASTGAVVVDTAVLSGLAALDRPLCLILRETGEKLQSNFQLEKGRAWDLVIVPNPAGEWLPDPALVAAQRVEAVGWIYRKQSQMTKMLTGETSLRRQILIASGGGGSGRRWAQFRIQTAALIAVLRTTLNIPFEVVQCLGPRCAEDTRIQGVDYFIEPGAQLPEAFSRADLVISTAGYNSVLELALTTIPVLLMPITNTYDDQFKRVQQWAARLGYTHDPDNPAVSASWAANLLAGRERRKPVNLGASGAVRAAQLIEEFAA